MDKQGVIYIYTHTHTHTHIHIYIHICVYTYWNTTRPLKRDELLLFAAMWMDYLEGILLSEVIQRKKNTV